MELNHHNDISHKAGDKIGDSHAATGVVSDLNVSCSTNKDFNAAKTAGCETAITPSAKTDSTGISFGPMSGGTDAATGPKGDTHSAIGDAPRQTSGHQFRAGSELPPSLSMNSVEEYRSLSGRDDFVPHETLP